MDFSLFDKIKNESEENKVSEQKTECEHSVLISEQGTMLCYYCGSEANKESKNAYDGYMSNQLHCYTRKNREKSIYPDVQNMNISEHIKDLANEIYLEACQNTVHRGTKRKSIVFASVFHAYKLDDTPQSCETLTKLFNIDRKDALKGLKFISENLSKNSPVRTLYITPEHLICEFLGNFQVTEENKAEIIKLYYRIQNRSAMINRSRPQSVASGVIWYWVKLNKKSFSIKEFVKRVVLSELTVIKMAREVERICNSLN